MDSVELGLELESGRHLFMLLNFFLNVNFHDLFKGYLHMECKNRV